MAFVCLICTSRDLFESKKVRLKSLHELIRQSMDARKIWTHSPVHYMTLNIIINAYVILMTDERAIES